MMGVFATRFDPSAEGLQLVERVSWLPSLGLEWSLGVDGLSAPLVVLSGLVTLLSVAASWSVQRKPRLYFALMLVQASARAWCSCLRTSCCFPRLGAGVGSRLFVDRDLGRTKPPVRRYQIHPVHGAGFPADPDQWAGAGSIRRHLHVQSHGTGRSVPRGSFGLLCYLGFLIGFGVKLPMFPLHTWLPDAHGEANAPVSMLLAGVLLKMGGYALLRFNVQMLPDAHFTLAPALVILGIVNIVYGALNAFAQDNVKRRIACSSVSHMGFVLVGIGAVDALGISGDGCKWSAMA